MYMLCNVYVLLCHAILVMQYYVMFYQSDRSRQGRFRIGCFLKRGIHYIDLSWGSILPLPRSSGGQRPEDDLFVPLPAYRQ